MNDGRRMRTMRSPIRTAQKMTRSEEFALVGTVGGLALALVAMIILSAPVVQRMALRSPQVAAVVAANLVDLLNADRAANHLSSLAVNPALVAAAQAKANDMAARGYFAHVAPDGKDSWYWFKQAGYDFSYAGENLAVDFSESNDVQHAWMLSPSHHENIVNSNYTEVGIATAVGTYQGHSTVFAVQMFGAPSLPDVAEVPVADVPDVSVPAPAPIVKVSTVTAPKPIQKVIARTPVPTPSAPRKVLAAEITPRDAQNALQTPSVILAPIADAAKSPRSLLLYVFYALVGLLLAALAVETELEFHARHRRTAYATGGFAFVIGIGLLFVSQVYFPLPFISHTSAMTTSAGAARE